MKLMDRLLELMNSKKKIGCWDLVTVYKEYFMKYFTQSVHKCTSHRSAENAEKQLTAFSTKEYA